MKYISTRGEAPVLGFSDAVLAGLAAKAVLGSLVPVRSGWILARLGDSPLAAPLLAAGTALAFGVTYLAVASALGVGVPLKRLLRR